MAEEGVVPKRQVVDNGFLHVDDKHIIVHTRGLNPGLTEKQIKTLCRQAFPDLFNHPKRSRFLGGKTRKITVTNETCWKMIPSWFDQAIIEANRHNDWDEYPFVAMCTGYGFVHLKPLATPE